MDTPTEHLCASVHAGHGLSVMQDRLARATPSRWIDAIVTQVDGDGWLTLATLDGRSRLRVWNHEGVDVEAGAPVALHDAFHVLAAGGERYNVAVAR
ncbi:hypothetical protein [Gryllotalpicola ginsengisoli]|uniref:hypothetical protein n=1 Tax=Gryllotalpicola ginsengisoli TaxID=444608 RepID=UPI0003B36F4B|nr:hypothetical protein [Gryllotalpicola ginsengisoli]